jgi:hypothetical protein
MFDRVDVNVIDVARKIDFIANRMLPIASLPDTAFAFAGTTAGDRLVDVKLAGERRFDKPPARREIRIALRQRPDRVEMIR